MDEPSAVITVKVAAKKERLDAMRPVSRAALLALRKSYDVDLTYHLDAVDHYHAVLWMREPAPKDAPVDEATVRELHRRILFRSQPEFAGVYSMLPRRIAGSPVIFPNPAKMPQLMKEFDVWLSNTSPSPEASFEAHYRVAQFTRSATAVAARQGC